MTSLALILQDNPDEKSQLPSNMIVIHPKGEFIAAGATSMVERLPSGDVMKTPLAGDDQEQNRCNEIEVEARIYERLGEHPRLVKMKAWDPNSHTMVLEYMPNGTLERYMRSHKGQIPPAQRLRWVAQAVESLQVLHSGRVLHCDIGPHNLLLDADKNIKIADFSGSSIDGSRAMICPAARYTAPDLTWRPGSPPTAKEDIFSLGSTIYFILTGKSPFDELPDEQVERKFLDGEFPDLAGLPCEEIIRKCWHQEASSIQVIQELVDKLDFQEGL